MVFRLQLDMEIDTATRQTRVVNPPLLTEGGGEHVCLNAHCQKIIPLRLKYCTRTCYQSSGNKRPRKGTVMFDEPLSHKVDPQLVHEAVVVNVTPTIIATPELIPAPSPVVDAGVVRDYSHFSMSLTMNGGA